MNKLEYLRTKSPTDAMLEALGENGWELVAIDDETYVFMRHKRTEDFDPELIAHLEKFGIHVPNAAQRDN